MPRILMTADAVGGVWQYATSLAAGLSDQGFETLLAVLGPEPDAGLLAAARGVEVVASGLPLDWTGSTPDATRDCAARLAAIAARERCDLVHLNSPLLAGAAAFPVPVVSVAHGCVSTWWSAARSAPLDPAFAWHHAMTVEGLAASDLAVAPSAAYAEDLRRTYGLARNIAVVHNGREPLVTGDGAGPMAPFAFTAGRLWDEVKNTAVLDAVAAGLSAPFHAAGSIAGPNGERVTPGYLDLLGTLGSDELAGWLGLRPVFVSAARFEPFGLAVLEAAQAGCPLVLSDITTFRELWEGAAIFAPADDARAFVAAVEALLADPEARERQGQRARERAHRYSVAAMAGGMARLYASLGRRRAAA